MRELISLVKKCIARQILATTRVQLQVFVHVFAKATDSQFVTERKWAPKVPTGHTFAMQVFDMFFCNKHATHGLKITFCVSFFPQISRH